MLRLAAIAIACAATAGFGGCSLGEDEQEQYVARLPETAAQREAGRLCQQVEPVERPPARLPAPPPLEVPRVVTLVTSCGDVTVRLDPRSAPHSAGTLATLAGSGFYDGAPVRVVTGMLIQVGDGATPDAGIATFDAPSRRPLRRGDVAMAPAGAGAAAAGSQFFIVTADGISLGRPHPVVGTVVDGESALDLLDALGSLSSRRPSKAAAILSTGVASR